MYVQEKTILKQTRCIDHSILESFGSMFVFFIQPYDENDIKCQPLLMKAILIFFLILRIIVDIDLFVIDDFTLRMFEFGAETSGLSLSCLR